VLRITIELDKGGLGTDIEVLGTGVIKNDCTGTNTLGNYTFEFNARRLRIKKGRLVGFQRSRSVWWLLFYCLKLAFWEDADFGELYRNGSPQSFKNTYKKGFHKLR